MTAARTQLDALTGARGLAAWLVVFYHIRLALPDSIPASVIAVLAKGYLAVDLFFVLSGFVMWLTYGAIFQRDGLSAAPAFLWRRLARIYPLHLAILLATIAYAGALAAAGKADPAQYPLAELPLHLLLLQNWGLTDHLTWNDPSWSISTEFAAYLLLPLAAVTLFRRDWPPILCALGVVALAALLHFWFALQGEPTLGRHIVWNGLPRCLAGFFAGVLMAMAWRAAAKPIGAIAAATACAALFGWGACILPETLAIPLAFPALVYALAATSAAPRNPLSGGIAVHLGDISYSTYLAHFLLWIVFKHLFVADAANVPLGQIALYLGAVYLASEALYRMIEAPGRTLLQSLANRGASPLRA
ncbi:acyltransferase [Chakrabartia godavariana]|nr:acyltransferase [Chakrabartia godavariana]